VATDTFCAEGNVNQNEQIMQNKANFSKSQMFTTSMKATNYSEKMKLDTWSKRTQTNPTCPERSRRVCSEQSRTILPAYGGQVLRLPRCARNDPNQEAKTLAEIGEIGEDSGDEKLVHPLFERAIKWN
jgi:hypothetical protein